MSSSRNYDGSISALRGLAVVLMVSGHVIGVDSDRGMRVADETAWRWAYAVLEDVRMPLFTVLSGYVYSLRPVRKSSSVPHFVKAKARRLLVPMLIIAPTMFALQLLAPTNFTPDLGSVWRIYLFGYQHLWFLQAIFLIFAFVAVLDACHALRTHVRLLTACVASAFLFLTVTLPGFLDVFSLSGAIRLLPFFLLGIALQRIASVARQLGAGQALVLVAAIALTVRVSAIAGHISLTPSQERALSLAVGVTGILALFVLRRGLQNRALAWLGTYSFGIYLLHVFATSSTRIALSVVGLHDDRVHFCLGLVAGLLLPIAFELTAGRVRLIRTLVLGGSGSPLTGPSRARKRTMG